MLCWHFLGLVLCVVFPRVRACPADMVPTGVGTCIDRYEWPNKKGVRPLVGASGIPEAWDVRAGRVLDARSLCASVGKRVCGRREWEHACYGPGGARYPWGSHMPRYTPGKRSLECSQDKHYRSVDEAGVARRNAAVMRGLDQSEPSGSRKTCRSASGAYDMTGNVEEWVRCKAGKYGWCLMGRYWAEPEDCDYAVTVHSPRWHYYETGFRCCKKEQ